MLVYYCTNSLFLPIFVCLTCAKFVCQRRRGVWRVRRGTCIKMVVSLHCSFWCIWLKSVFIFVGGAFYVAVSCICHNVAYQAKMFLAINLYTYKPPKILWLIHCHLFDTNLGCTFTLIFCLIPFLQSVLCICSCFLSSDPTTYSFEQHCKFVFHECTSTVKLFSGKE